MWGHWHSFICTSCTGTGKGGLMKLQSLFLCIFEQSSHAQLPLFFFPFLSFSGTCCCPSRLFRGSDWLHTCVCLFLWVTPGFGLFCGGWCCGGWVGHASRRAMLQQLHGVTMYSHDEHHTTTTSYCWNERGKRALAMSAAVLLTSVRSSVQMSLRPVTYAMCHLKHSLGWFILSWTGRNLDAWGGLCSLFLVCF